MRIKLVLMEDLALKTISAVQTKKAGRVMAGELLKTRTKKHALILALSGELGSGKTTFTQGLAKGLGIRQKIKSPTFVVIKRYALNARRYKNFIHIDAYRLTRPKDILALGWRKMARDSKNIIAIEWARRIKRVLPRPHLDIHFDFLSLNSRKIIFNANEK